jgi:shikimate dehydrogenase
MLRRPLAGLLAPKANKALLMDFLYAVLGNPVAHSRSPDIHAAFAKQTGQPVSYGRVLIELEQFEHQLSSLQSQGLLGANITVPFKERAWQWMIKHNGQISARAQAAQAANTLVLDAKGLRCDNTDGIGLVADLNLRLGQSLRNKKILIIGAGGATQGVLGPLLGQQPAQVVVMNRSHEKTLALAKRFEITPLAWDKQASCPAMDMVINATSAGLQQGLLLDETFTQRVMGNASLCYDMMYGAKPTAWMQAASQAGCAQVHDGLGMLVQQAAYAFAFWRGVLPDTQPVYDRIRLALGAH